MSERTLIFRRETATVHFSSRSLLLEVEGDALCPILKYPFRFADNPPLLGKTSSSQVGESLVVEVSRIIEVPTGKVPKPYK